MSQFYAPKNRLKDIGDNWNDLTERGFKDEDSPQVEDISHEDEQPIVGSYSLKYFQAATFATILEDIITELRILGECNNELRIVKTMSDMEKLRALKYQVLQPKVKDELDGIDPHKLGCMRYKLDKLAADRKYLNDVLTSTYLNLSLTRSYRALIDRINMVKEKDAYHAFLVEEEARNKATRRELMRQLRQQRNHFKTVTYDTDLAIDDLKSQVEDAALNAEIRSRYVENWQRARTEQHVETIYIKESGPSDSINQYRRKADHEQRVHTEVELVTNIMINEKLQEVESWMNKYDQDMEEIDLKIQIKKHNYQIALQKRIELEQTYEKHDKFMKGWINFKEEREKERQCREKMTNAAITVQAWWRGLLVRLELGPYKPVRRRGPPPPPAAEKKKKK